MSAKLRSRVEAAAEAALNRQKYVAPLDVLLGLGWVRNRDVEEWRLGRFPVLTSRVSAPPERRAEVLEYLAAWARAKGLGREDAEYAAAGRERRPLVFEPGRDPAYRAHWVRTDLTDAQRARLTAKQNKAPDLKVMIAERPWICAECDGGGPHYLEEDGAKLCLACADFDHLILLPSGDAALTRRAQKASALSAVVVIWNKRRKRFERRGTLVEEAALLAAEEACLADEDVRARRRDRDALRREAEDLTYQAAFTTEITRLFPRCPPERAAAIAAHAALRGSGRVGRTAAAKSLDESAITAAVIASIRHLDTPYDFLLMSGTPRPTARTQIRPTVEKVLTTWR
ncbi:DUF2293 domain-containing protein [Actinocorallia lasiicapitis]